MTGSCVIKPSTVVGITCAAEHFDLPELKQACYDRLSDCLTAKSVCIVLTQLEKYLSYHAAKTMVVRALEFVDGNASDVLMCEDFLCLSENMVYLILRRDIEVNEILKVKAALAWGSANFKKGIIEYTVSCTCTVESCYCGHALWISEVAGCVLMYCRS